MALTKIYVYGTLRPGDSPVSWGYGTMFDIGHFPAVILPTEGGPVEDQQRLFAFECIEVDDNRLKRLDSYEGYSVNNPEDSLYLRVPFKDGFIYVWNRNRPPESSRVECGDWLIYKDTRQISNVA